LETADALFVARRLATDYNSSMSAPLSQEFVVSFLTVCFDEGLSKEAAAELLQRETLDQEFAERPAFAQGYLAVASQVPGQMRPLRAGYEGMEKMAARGKVGQGLITLGKSLFWDAPKALGDVITGSGSAVRTGVGKVKASPTLRRRPFEAVLGASALTGAGVYGVNRWANRDNVPGPARTSPFFSPGGYSPQSYQDNYDAQLDSYKPGIHSHNKDHFGTEKRRTELEKAVAEGKGGDAAYLELQQLNRGHATSTKARKQHLDSLEGNQNYNRQLVDQIAKRTQSLENQRTAWWAAPRRAWARMKGEKPQDYFDQKIADLHGSRAAAKTEADLAADRQRLLWAGVTEDNEVKQPTRQELQQRFFKTF
jgi:hypothetical protein